MKKIILCLACSAIALTTTAQNVYTSFGVNYASFAMEDATEFQDELWRQLPVRSEKMSEFPNFFGYEGKVYLAFSKFQVGLFGAFNSTGSRLSYSDYSGSFEYNQTATMTQFGIGFEYALSSDIEKPWQPFVSVQVAKGWTNFTIDDMMVVGSQMLVEEKLEFESGHVTIQPGVGLRRTLFKKVFATGQAGYLIDIAEPLQYKEDNDLYLFDDNYNKVSADWSGFRLSLSVGLQL